MRTHKWSLDLLGVFVSLQETWPGKCQYEVTIATQEEFEAGITHTAMLSGKYNQNAVPTVYSKEEIYELMATPDPRIQVKLSGCEKAAAGEHHRNSGTVHLASLKLGFQNAPMHFCCEQQYNLGQGWSCTTAMHCVAWLEERRCIQAAC